jgi:hypothetical protein
MTRRALLHATSGSGLLILAEPLVFGASDFWNKKQATEWSAADVEQLITRSPWAKKVRGELEGSGPSVGNIGGSGGGRRGGSSPDGGEEGSGGGGGGGGRGGGRGTGGPGEDAGGSRIAQGTEVIIRWETAKPIADALKETLPAALNNHYAIGVVGLPPQMLTVSGGGRGRGRDRERKSAPPPDTPEDPAARQKAMIERIKAGSALTCKGKDPVSCDLLMQTANQQTLIFGFPRDGFPLAASDKQVVFTLKLRETFKAKFELREMTYGGQLAV